MTALFDMDGLLLDTEPLWGESMLEVARHYQIPILPQHFKETTGLRIYEVTAYWQERFPWPGNASAIQVAEDILDNIISRAKQNGRIMPGALNCLEWMQQNGIRRGLATSSPMRMLDELIDHYHLRSWFEALVSADTAIFGKPHPEVFLQCAHALNESPWNCVALEDSLNGMIAAKAARMKVIVVPETAKYHDPGFGLAEIKLPSLEAFNEDIWRKLQ